MRAQQENFRPGIAGGKTAKQSCTRGVGWVSEEGISDLGSGDPNVILKSKEMNSRRVKKVNKLDFGGPINWKM